MTRRYALVLMIVLVVTADVARADDRLTRIMMAWPARDFAALRVQIHEALAAYREAGDPRREAIAYLFLGLAEMPLGEEQSARVHFGDAARRFEAAGDSVGAWLAYWLFAEHERLLETPSDDVLPFYEKAFAMLEKARSPSAPISLDSVMVVGPVVGLPPAEYEPHAMRPELGRPILLQLFEVFTRDGYGAVLLEIGELEKAEEQLGRAKEAAAFFEGRLDPPIDRHIGRLRRRQGRLEEARESYRKALESLQVMRPMGIITPARLRVELLGDLAEIEILSGRIDDALAWNDRALELVRAAKNPEVEVEFLKDRAEMLGKAGRFAAAERVLAEASVLAERHEYFHFQISILRISATMNRIRGRYGAAAADMEKALEIVARANQPSREPGILNNLAMMYVQLDASDSARIALEKARELAEKHGRCLELASLDLLEATRKFTIGELSLPDFYKAVGRWMQTPDFLRVPGSEHLLQLVDMLTGSASADPQAAVRSGFVAPGTIELLQAGVLFSEGREHATARELARKGMALNPNPKHRAGALMVIGGTYVREGDEEKGIAYLIQSMDALDAAAEEARADPLLRTSSDGGWPSTAFDLLVRLLAKHRRYEEAFALSERARARVFLQLMGNHRVSPRGPENTLPAQEAETLRTQMLQWQQQLRLAPTRQLEDDLRQARRRYDALMTRVKAANPEYAAMTGVEPLQLGAIREELPPNTTLVSYFASANLVHAWVIDRTTLQYVALPFGAEALARAECAAKRFRAGGRGARPLDASCQPAPAEELYARLFAPIRGYVRNSRLIIAPHGALHYLPFGAFRDPRTERYLIEDYTITYAPSASAIRFLRGKETPVNGRALVIGAPAGVSPELPGAMREAMFVGAELRSSPMVGTAAKESLLYRLKGEVDLVHIAAHGFYETDTPLFSRLALAAGDGNDGNLEVHEILSDVDLTGVNLVVLSACQTALGKSSAGDEIVSLTRALLYAGTPGVISTLWDIGDDAAAALMSHFYDRLLGGDSAADALRHAQLQLLRGDHPDPRQWAAFTLHGDPQGRWKPSAAVTAAGRASSDRLPAPASAGLPER